MNYADITICWNCLRKTTIYAISHDGLCFDCSTTRNQSEDPEEWTDAANMRANERAARYGRVDGHTGQTVR